MAITGAIDLIASALWPQGDVRDPLGIWGARGSITGDASAGSIKVTIQVPAGLAAAYIYTAYQATITLTTGTSGNPAKIRLLTNWPDVDTTQGVQGFGSVKVISMATSADFTAPTSGPLAPLVSPLDRFLLLFDPRPSAGVLELMELEIGENVLNDVYAFEAYGYFWDRSVLQAPGGLRHPGSS